MVNSNCWTSMLVPGVFIFSDLAAAFSEMFDGELSVTNYIGSLRRTGIESVFSWRDPLPGFAEMALLPYLLAKTYCHFPPRREAAHVSPAATEAEPHADELCKIPALAGAAGDTHGDGLNSWPDVVEKHPRSYEQGP